MRRTLNGATFLHLRLSNNLRERVKTLINDPLLFNQIYVANHLIKPLMCLMILGENNMTRMYQVLYYFYNTDENMYKHAPNINNTYILTHEVHQVTNFTKDGEFDQG